MAVGLKAPERLLPVAGVRLASTAAGVRYPDRPDLALVELAPDSRTAAVFTRNAFCAAPVQVARWHLERTQPRYLLINAGNANAGTGEAGLQDALATSRVLAEATGCREEEVLPFSTGVIGERLPADRIGAAVPELIGNLDAGGWLPAARAIMTTDTLPKGVSKTVEIEGRTVTVTGIAKGSGMIRPDMATMLAFIVTDAELPQELLRETLHRAVEQSFNRITVDGDTSTNDACTLTSTGRAGVRLAGKREEGYAVLREALTDTMRHLAESIVRDGEGATKFVRVQITGAADTREARMVADTVAHSPLIKTALFASDPNWGRMLAAVGRAGLEALAIEKVSIRLNDLCVIENGAPAPGYTEAAGRAVVAGEDIAIRVDLQRGSSEVEIWTTDLSYEYVRINAEYRS